MATIVTRSGKGSPLTSTEMDSNLTNLNTDKYESGDDAVFQDITTTGDIVASIGATISAAGTTQGDATVLFKTYNVVTGGTANQGVKLPTAAAGLLYTVINATSGSVSIKLYPDTSGTINSGSTNASIDVATGTTVKLVGTNSTNWNTMVETVVYDSSGNRLN